MTTISPVALSNLFTLVCLWVDWKCVYSSREPNFKSCDCKNIRFKSFNMELYLFVIILVEYIKLKFVYGLTANEVYQYSIS